METPASISRRHAFENNPNPLAAAVQGAGVTRSAFLGGLGAIVPLAAHGGRKPVAALEAEPEAGNAPKRGRRVAVWVCFSALGAAAVRMAGMRTPPLFPRLRLCRLPGCRGCAEKGGCDVGGWRRGTGPWRTERAVKRGINRLLRRDVAVLRYYGGDSQEVFGDLRCGLKVAGFRSISRCGWRCAGGWCGRRSQSRRARSCRCRALPPLHP